MKEKRNVLFGLYNDEGDVLDAVKKANDQGLKIMDVYSPFPIHGIDDLLGLKESRLHKGGFWAGAFGGTFGFLFMTWVFTRDWPLVFGGKPFWSVPAFIPITFEMVVLISAISMVVAFYAISGLWPGVGNVQLDERITDDKFCISFKTNNLGDSDIDKMKDFFKNTGAVEVNAKVV